MNTIEKTLEYHELLMIYEDTSKYGSDELPNGFHYDFFKPGDEESWSTIHIKSGEFMSMGEGLKIFYDFYDYFYDELAKRLFFVVNENGEKVATGTISKLKEQEFGYDAVVDWFAIKKEYQGCKLAKPMINKLIKLANELGHEKLLLHTQTHTWLAAKLYLDLGFERFNVKEDIKGWQILKTITNHSKLSDIDAIPEDRMYFDIALKTKQLLDDMFGINYEYSIWHINGRHDVEVNYNDILYKFKYYDDENGFRLDEDDLFICRIANENEMKERWDYEIEIASNKENWIIWKNENLERFRNREIIPYYGFLNGKCICEATAMINPSIVQNSNGLVGGDIVYLSAFRTNKEYQGQGYFSKLFKFMIDDLRKKGYNKVTLGVEPDEFKNKQIYNHYGFTEHIKNSIEKYPDGTEIEVEYYGKSLK